MVPAAVFGGGFGLGLFLLYRALRPRPVPLARALADLDRRGTPVVDPARDKRPAQSLEERVGQAVLELVETAGLGLAANPRDLRVVGRTRQTHATHKVVLATIGLAGPSTVGLMWALAGGGLAPLAVLAACTVAATAAGWWVPDYRLSRQAQERRRDFRHQLSSFLDLVNVMSAGGAGIETALHTAARSGGGWVFQLLRRRLNRAGMTGQSHWEAFAELGEEIGVSELSELAAATSLAATGAKLRQTLATRGDTLRAHQLAETEDAAEQATARMGLPLGVMILGYLLFLGYPAVWQITTAAAGAPLP